MTTSSNKASGKKQAAKKSSKKEAKGTKTLSPDERPTPNERTSFEAATMLGITESGVRQQVRRGNIEGRKVGRYLWITVEEIRRYKRERNPVGRPVDTITGESKNKRGPGETEYQRDYKRRKRAAAKKAAGGKGGVKARSRR